MFPYVDFFFFCCIESTIWSGLKLGPPRRLKFPTGEDLVNLVDEIKKIIT